MRITSPQGRTGAITKVRIVAQIKVPAAVGPAKAWFYVDGKLVGSVEDGPSYSVDWVDENPFERREIVVQAQDTKGRTMEDKVVLPPFEITDQSEVSSVLLDAGVYDTHNRLVSGLDPAAFLIRENGVPQTADQIATEILPTTILLLVDNSQSMSRRMDFVRLSAERLGAALRRRDKIIVAPFNKQIGAITGPTSDAATITGAIGAMRAEGGTAILDAVREGSKLLQGAVGRRVVILITDGYDENSKGDLDVHSEDGRSRTGVGVRGRRGGRRRYFTEGRTDAPAGRGEDRRAHFFPFSRVPASRRIPGRVRRCLQPLSDQLHAI